MNSRCCEWCSLKKMLATQVQVVMKCFNVRKGYRSTKYHRGTFHASFFSFGDVKEGEKGVEAANITCPGTLLNKGSSCAFNRCWYFAFSTGEI